MKISKKKKINDASNIFIAVMFLLAAACSSSKKHFDPNKKFPAAKLKDDYNLFRNILEESHPGLYWYTPKDSINYYFNVGYSRIKDSMTEPQFRALLSYVIAKINCGHTTTKNSKAFAKYLVKARSSQFPIGIKFLQDTAVISANMNKRDTVLTPGTIVNSINNLPINVIRDSIMQFISADGYNTTHKRQTMSNGYAFGQYYKSVFGDPGKFNVHYAAKGNVDKTTTTSLYKTKPDSSFKNQLAYVPKPSKKERKKLNLENDRSLKIDTLKSTGVLELTTFASGKSLKHFIRHSFKKLRKLQVQHLIIDVRNNGGGDVSNSTLLTRLLTDKKFKLADSLYAVRKGSKYKKYINNRVLIWPFMTMTTRKRKDGLYHFGFYERHYFKPLKHNHFNGDVYILTGGNSFSATSLFAGALKGQKNILIVGEETGGGQYGNCAWFIPDATLPNTKIRFRLPKFRLVINNNIAKNGRGIMPDVEVVPTTVSISQGRDLKMAKALELIEKKEDSLLRH